MRVERNIRGRWNDVRSRGKVEFLIYSIVEFRVEGISLSVIENIVELKRFVSFRD